MLSDQQWVGKSKPILQKTSRLHGPHQQASSATWDVLELLHALVHGLERLDDILLQLLSVNG